MSSWTVLLEQEIIIRASSRTGLVRRQRRWAAARGVSYDVRGYLRTLADNLRVPLGEDALAELARGSELAPSPTRPPRLHSLYSSAALVLNVFEHWRGRDATPLARALGVGGDGVAARLAFEEPLPTGLPGDPPTADIALRWPTGRLVAVESKFGEPLVRRPRSQRAFKDKYFPPGERVWEAHGLPRCQALAEALQGGHVRAKWLHAAQLLKHALGLARSGASEWTLVYLFYEHGGRESRPHRDELARMQEAVAGEVDLVGRSYQELYAALCSDPSVDAGYLRYLGERYFD
jgi:hypothetical protein